MSNTVVELIEFLNVPAHYSDSTKCVKVIQTHASIVAICDQYVYKVKKPVDFEFLDFSTVDKRKFYCEEEVRLNNRLAKDIYLGVWPIYRNKHGQLTFEAGDQIEDYAIKMRRMSDEGFLSFLILSNTDQAFHYELMTERLTNFYSTLPPQSLNPEYGTVQSVSFIIDENQAIRKQFLGKTMDVIQEECIAGYQKQFLDTHSELFQKRIGQGWVRDVHGDLRPDHFHFDGEKLSIYDCIEFQERLRVNDVVNDLAFICMELEFAGRSIQSKALFKSVTRQIGDVPSWELWHFYKAHRACVRGMVHAVTGYEPEVLEDEKELSRKKSEELFGLATRYALFQDRPQVIVIYGGTATGKSTIATEISKLLYAPLIQSDVVRKELAGLDLQQYPDESTRRWLYAEEMTLKTYREMIVRAQIELARYNMVILDSRWATSEQRDMLNDSLEGIDIHWIKVEVKLDIRKKRLLARENNPSVSDARLDILESLLLSEGGLNEQKPSLIIDTCYDMQFCKERVIGYFSN